MRGSCCCNRAVVFKCDSSATAQTCIHEAPIPYERSSVHDHHYQLTFIQLLPLDCSGNSRATTQQQVIAENKLTPNSVVVQMMPMFVHVQQTSSKSHTLKPASKLALTSIYARQVSFTNHPSLRFVATLLKHLDHFPNLRSLVSVRAIDDEIRHCEC